MNLENFLIKFQECFPPYKRSVSNSGILETTETVLQKLIELITCVDDQSFEKIQTTKLQVIDSWKDQKDIICSSIESYLQGDIVECYNKIFKKYFWEKHGIEKNIFYKPLLENYPFYRLRVNDSNTPFTYQDMFHIPFNLIEMVSNQRFSISGYPCLYLGNSSYCCWEELQRPNFDRCNFSILKSNTSLNFFDLTPPITIKSKHDLYRLPLVVSCALKFTKDKSPFKAEYIISQAVLQSLVRFNNKNILLSYSSEISKFHGLIYLSTHADKSLYTDLNYICNYVIPTVNRKNDVYCQDLSKIFEVSDSVSYQELWLRFPQIFSIMDENDTLHADDYKYSVFNIIEKYLKSKNVKKYNL